MARKVYMVEQQEWDENHRIPLLATGREPEQHEWAGLLAEAYGGTRTLRKDDPEQTVVAAAAWLVARGGFEYADEVRG